MNDNTAAHLPRPIWVVSTLLGLGMVVLGGLLVVAPLVLPGLFASVAVVTAGFGLILATLGISMAAAGVRGWQGKPSRPFYSRWGWIVFVLLSVGIGVLGIALPAEAQSRLVFAPIHFALITFPGLLLFSLLALVVGRDQAVALRRMILAVAGGASSVLLAIPVEIVGLLLSSAVAAGLVLLTPSGSQELDRMLSLLMQWAERPPTDESEIMAVLISPLVLITLGLTLAVIAPLIEELGKTLVMGVMGIWVKPSPLTAFLWGVACGLGFAWFEGVSNGALALGGGVGWAGSVAVRFFATVMHALTSGIIGLGWAAYWRPAHRRRRWWLLFCYAIAVAFHGLWNLNVIFSLAGIGLSANSPALGSSLAVIGAVIQGSLILIALGSIFGIPAVIRRRQRQ